MPSIACRSEIGVIVWLSIDEADVPIRSWIIIVSEVPEFPTFVVMPFFVTTTLMTSTICKRRTKDLNNLNTQDTYNADRYGLVVMVLKDSAR